MSSYHSDVTGKAEYLWQQYVTTDGGDAHELAWALSTAGVSYSRRGEHCAAIESSELAVRMLRDRIDHGVGTQDDEAALPYLLANLAGAHDDAHHPAETLATWREAVERQRHVRDVAPYEDDDWVLADILHGYAAAAMNLGFDSEARASLREAEELLAPVFARRPRFARELMDQIAATRTTWESKQR